MRINSDSMLMLRVKTPGDPPPPLNVTFEPEIAATYAPHYDGNVMHMDEKGGVSLHPIGGILNDTAEPTANGWRFRLSNSQNFWVSVFPPKPFDWDKANERVFWEWGCAGDQGAYPSNANIDSVNQTPFASNNKTNVLLLQGGEYLWENWNAAFEPRFPTEFSRVITHAHQSNMRVVVYASPLYFTKGHVTKDPDHPENQGFDGREWNPCEDVNGNGILDPGEDLNGNGRLDTNDAVGVNTGENSQTYLDAINKLLSDYHGQDAAHPEVDGIYFDEIYPFNLPESYAVIRKTRKLLGSSKRELCITLLGGLQFRRGLGRTVQGRYIHPRSTLMPIS